MTEILASNRIPPLQLVVLGGLHGHGASTSEGINPSRRKQRNERIWRLYLERLGKHNPRLVTKLIAVHNSADRMCPWADAACIIDAFSRKRELKDMSKVEVKLVVATGKKSTHNYGDAAFDLCMTRSGLSGR